MSDVGRFLLAGATFILVLVLPLTVYLALSGQAKLRLVLSILAIWLIWNVVNAPIHEGAHWIGGHLLGLQAKDYRLIQHFWEGDFVHGYIVWENPGQRALLVSTSPAYIADGVLMLGGFLLFRKWKFGPFVRGLILAVTYLRSVFDVSVNYLADTLFGGKGDFDSLFRGYPPGLIHLGARPLVRATRALR